MIDKNYSQLILKGIEEGDQIGGPYELAKILLGSLKQKNGFNENDLRNKYLDWWKGEAFDTGPTYASVFNKINKGMDPQLAVKRVHEEFEADTFFPKINENEWQLINEEKHEMDERHEYSFTYKTYLKIK